MSVCAYCGVEFGQLGRGRPRLYCSDLCRNRVKKDIVPRMLECDQCGDEYTTIKQGPSRYCGKRCRMDALNERVRERRAAGYKRPITEAAVASRKRARAKRRALERGASAAYTVDVIAVFRRDRWHCQECGVHTPKDDRGSHADWAPELDHIVPLALGGKHAYDNVQLLCRACNGSKGAAHPSVWHEAPYGVSQGIDGGRGLEIYSEGVGKR